MRWDPPTPDSRRPCRLRRTSRPTRSGLALVGGVAAVTAAHGAATYARELRNGFVGRRRAARVAVVAGPVPSEAIIEPTIPVEPPVADAPDTGEAPE